MNRFALGLVGLAAILLLVGASPLGVTAAHEWGNFHWARSANTFALDLGDNVSGSWDTPLRAASVDWTQSEVLDTRVVAGSTNPRSCNPRAGRAEVCNAKYGANGWLGIAQIWISGDHVTQGVVKLNDTYFNTRAYNTPAWRRFVMCQEIGHIFGLDHQDDVFGNPNLGTCMDYTNDPTTNITPNEHDFEQLSSTYEHFDTTTTVGSNALRAPAVGAMNTPGEWGRMVSQSANGKSATFERDLGNGVRVVTHVYYAN